MRYSNFKFIKTLHIYKIDYATVDVTTGFLRWKKTETRVIFKYCRDTDWGFIGTDTYLISSYTRHMYDEYLKSIRIAAAEEHFNKQFKL